MQEKFYEGKNEGVYEIILRGWICSKIQEKE